MQPSLLRCILRIFVLIAMVAVPITLPTEVRPAGPSPAAGGEIAVPQNGSAAERTRALWQTIRPLLLADAQASLTDEEYLARRAPVHAAWQKLEWEVAETSSDAVSQFSRRVWMLIGDLYGSAGTKAEYRQKVRARTRSRIEEKLQALEAMAAALL